MCVCVCVIYTSLVASAAHDPRRGARGADAGADLLHQGALRAGRGACVCGGMRADV